MLYVFLVGPTCLVVLSGRSLQSEARSSKSEVGSLQRRLTCPVVAHRAKSDNQGSSLNPKPQRLAVFKMHYRMLPAFGTIIDPFHKFAIDIVTWNYCQRRIRI